MISSRQTDRYGYSKFALTSVLETLDSVSYRNFDLKAAVLPLFHAETVQQKQTNKDPWLDKIGVTPSENLRLRLLEERNCSILYVYTQPPSIFFLHGSVAHGD